MHAELTVRELVRFPRLHLRVAGEGAGLDRPVRWAHSTELLDPRAYLHGGELVLTVGSGLTGPERCLAFVDALSACRVAALGLGVGDVHEEPPEALVQACEEAGIPLLLVPPSTPFIEITELLAEHRIRTASDRTQRTTMGRLVDAVIRHQASPDLVRADVVSAGLDPQHLVASLWSRHLEEDVEQRFETSSHVLADLEEAVLLVSGDVDEVSRAATSLGVASRVSAPFGLDDLAEAVSALLADWSNLAGAADSHHGPLHAARTRSHYTYLVNSLPMETLEPLLADLIDPLSEYDEGGAHLIESVEAFLQHDGSVQAAARSMHLHPNSLRHRLARVYELTGRNPLLFRDQVDFALALQALQRRRHTQPE